MAVKKIKAEQEPGASQAGDNSESGEVTGQEPNAQDAKDINPGPYEEDREYAGEHAETGEDAPKKPMPKVLTALRPILYLARQYKVGDSLPVNNTEMAKAWIAAGSAEWKEKKGGRFFP